MITTQDELLTILKTANIPYVLYEHPAVFTASEAREFCCHVPGAHVKNLFLRNQKKTAYWLVTVLDEKRVDLNSLGEALSAGRLSFANAESLVSMLGVQPGSVTPLAMINDKARRVQLLLDKDLQTSEFISVHPMENTGTIHLKIADLLKFIENYTQTNSQFMAIP